MCAAHLNLRVGTPPADSFATLTDCAPCSRSAPMQVCSAACSMSMLPAPRKHTSRDKSISMLLAPLTSSPLKRASKLSKARA